MLTFSKDDKTIFINKIMFATSQSAVKKIIDDLISSDQSTDTLLPFLSELITELETLSPLDNEAQQWSNIKISLILLYRAKINNTAIL